jgi:hypothetical protein
MSEVTALVAGLRDEEPPAITFDPSKAALPEPASGTDAASS